MSLVELKESTKKLESAELLEFARWIRQLEADTWDEQIAADLEAGHLDALLNAVKADIDSGNIKAL
jgi:hypothetical protein